MKLSFSTLVAADIGRVFDLSLDIGTHLESMAASGERAVDGVTSGLITLGESVTWKARHLGITWTMTSAITTWDPPHSFTDEQSRGPFKFFHHLHRFASEDGGTRMTDDISYEAPFGPLGAGVDRVILNRYLHRLIQVRNDFIVAEALKGQ